jgi:argininosuccinate lyase
VTHQLWGGRFEAEPSQLLRRFNDSFAFDMELFDEDVEGSIAWAQALGRAGVLTNDEASKIVAGLGRIHAPHPAFGHPLPPGEGEQPADVTPLPAGEGGATDDAQRRKERRVRGGQSDESYEDIHSYVESKLYDEIGDLAGKLHTGRSRNDQVATDLRLWLKRAAVELEQNVLAFSRTLAKLASEEAATPMPGYTHLKQAEPVTFGHWCLAYFEMLKRDRSRIADAIARGDESPLGAGALSGTPLDIDRNALAKSLGFARATANSLDSVSDRDFAAEYLFCASLVLSHLSRMAEDLIFFTSDEVAFAELPDALSTGSSRMPQKKNPDVLELVRGHAGRIIGELTGLLALMKALPLAYDKDLQLDKEPLFRTRATLAAALPALAALVAGLKLNRERMRAAASKDLLLATEVADSIAKRGIPFRQAHSIVSARIAEAIKAGKTLRELGPNAEGITPADLEALDVDRALSKRTALGGTSPHRVKEAAERALAFTPDIRQLTPETR